MARSRDGGRSGRSSRPTTRARRSSRRRGPTAARRCPRSGSAVAGASSCPATAATRWETAGAAHRAADARHGRAVRRAPDGTVWAICSGGGCCGPSRASGPGGRRWTASRSSRWPSSPDAVLSQRLPDRRPAGGGRASVGRRAPAGPPRRGRRADRRVRSGRSRAGRADGELPAHPDRGDRPPGRSARGRPGRRCRLPHRRDVRGVRAGRSSRARGLLVNEAASGGRTPTTRRRSSAPRGSRTPKRACPRCRT